MLFGGIPAYLVYKIKLNRAPLWRETYIKLLSIFSYPICFFILIYPLLLTYNHYVLSLSGLVAKVPYQIIPTNFFEGTFNHYVDVLTSHVPYKKIGTDAVSQSTSQKDKTLMVMVIGESARSINFQLNGYNKETNPYTKQQNIIAFQNVTSCATSTAESVPCIFSNLTKAHYSRIVADRRDNLLDILKRANLKVLWIDNNGPGDCQGVCKHIDSSVIQDTDGLLLDALKNNLKQLGQKDAVIVFHLKGSHGPAYYENYPPKFSNFEPSCLNSDLRVCNHDAVINTYDNSIRYTDFVLNEMINILKKQNVFKYTALIFTSDHGESIGEHGLYGHCAPNILAPKEQTEIPLLFWASDSFAVEKKLSLSCVQAHALNGKFSHDNIFHSILGLLDIRTSVYESKLDMFRGCRQGYSHPI